MVDNFAVGSTVTITNQYNNLIRYQYSFYLLLYLLIETFTTALSEPECEKSFLIPDDSDSGKGRTSSLWNRYNLYWN